VHNTYIDEQEITMNRVIENGNVAVLYSPGYGAGWYSWNECEPLLFDPVIVEMVRNYRNDEIESYVARAYPELNVYCGGAEQLTVAWIPVGERFQIDEYDGSESIALESEKVWITA
jgi:hypothetical protein